MSKKLTRALTVYDGKTEELSSLTELPLFSLPDFSAHFDVDKSTDPDMSDRYSIGPDDVTFVQKYLPSPLKFDFKEKAYFIESFLDDR